MRLSNICLLSNQVEKMIEFYQELFGKEPEYCSPIYGEFKLGVCSLCIFSMEEHNKMAPDSAKEIKDKSCLIEIEVADVDKEYLKLLTRKREIVKAPSIQPWGSKSVYFRDIDGNIINFFCYHESHVKGDANG